MNLGIYVSSLGDQDQMKFVSSCVNGAIENKEVTDASIFYDNIGFNEFVYRCGSFNATDLWNFCGELVVNNVNSLKNALNIVNSINLYYYYGFEKVKPIQLLSLLGKNFKVICNNDESADEFFRLTNTKPFGVVQNYTGIVKLIKENRDGYEKNHRDVCKAE